MTLTKREIIGSIGGLAWVLFDGLWMIGDHYDYPMPIPCVILWFVAVVCGTWYVLHKGEQN